MEKKPTRVCQKQFDTQLQLIDQVSNTNIGQSANLEPSNNQLDQIFDAMDCAVGL